MGSTDGEWRSPAHEEEPLASLQDQRATPATTAGSQDISPETAVSRGTEEEEEDPEEGTTGAPPPGAGLAAPPGASPALAGAGPGIAPLPLAAGVDSPDEQELINITSFNDLLLHEG